jgi:hypothetical protein
MSYTIRPITPQSIRPDQDSELFSFGQIREFSKRCGKRATCRLRYPSDLTEDEGNLVESLFPAGKRGGNPAGRAGEMIERDPHESAPPQVGDLGGATGEPYRGDGGRRGDLLRLLRSGVGPQEPCRPRSGTAGIWVLRTQYAHPEVFSC